MDLTSAAEGVAMKVPFMLESVPSKFEKMLILGKCRKAKADSSIN